MTQLAFKTLAATSWYYDKDKDPTLKGKTAKYSNVGPGKITAFNNRGLPIIKNKEVTWFIDSRNYLYITYLCSRVFADLGYILGASSPNDTVLKYRSNDKQEFKEYRNPDEIEKELIKTTDIEWMIEVQEGFDSFKHFISDENTLKHHGIKTIEEILDPVEVSVMEPESSFFTDIKQPETVDIEKVSSFIVDSIFEDKKLSMEDKISKMKDTLKQWMQAGQEQNDIIDSVCRSVTQLCETEGVIVGKNYVNDKSVVYVLNTCVDFEIRKVNYVKQSVKSCYDDICKTLNIPYDMNSDFKLADLIALTRHCQINKKVIVTNLLNTHHQPQLYSNPFYSPHMYPGMTKGHN